MSKLVILERVRRCHHCEREMKLSSQRYAENPFCAVCLPQRVKKATPARRPQWKLVGKYAVRVG